MSYRAFITDYENVDAIVGDDNVPIGAVLRNCPLTAGEMLGRVVRLTSPAGVRTIHLVTGAEEEGETTVVSFV